ncbi:hypothetical protein BPMI_02430c [Candidatus Burkholderia pumila]|uniref:DUF4148 domain-containing protein n=1 Tax=Candidatus Burkholderia pumila TaxID=1090375 RepID=A0ABR5HLW2_9BURK|nr:hypothetical protein BPMI_02430c [Candidatus Burkholderia pumila]
MKLLPIFSALALMFTLALADCVTNTGMQQSATRLSPGQCRDLTVLRDHAPLAPGRNCSELAALEAAGYDPSRFFDPYYPNDLQQAQRQVDQWYAADCQQTRTE